MDYKNKLLVQAVACLAIFALIRGSMMISAGGVVKARNSVIDKASKHYSIDDIKDSGSKLMIELADAPEAITAAITQADVAKGFGAPIDKESDEIITPVHSVAGGRVIYAGIDKELGLCIKIKHNEKTSVYGNLCTITAVTGDRIKKGEIIGTFDKSGDEEFYYNLEDDVL